eukprot:6480780-Amphidinium_carterae.1
MVSWTQRHAESIQSALCRLDTDRDLLGATTGGSKTFYGDFDDTEARGSEEPTVEDDDSGELVEYFTDPCLDVGFDSEEEDMIWVYATDLTSELEEAAVDYQFSTFEANLRAKQQAKKSRGWFAPTRWAEEHGSQKGSKGMRTAPKGSKKGSKGKGNGFGKGKGKGTGKTSQFEQLRQDRDVRRAQEGVAKVPTSQMTARIRCWRCGTVWPPWSYFSQLHSLQRTGQRWLQCKWAASTFLFCLAFRSCTCKSYGVSFCTV